MRRLKGFAPDLRVVLEAVDVTFCDHRGDVSQTGDFASESIQVGVSGPSVNAGNVHK